MEKEMETAMEEVHQDAAYHWNKIVELTDAIGLQVKDLNEQLRDFHDNPIFPHFNV